MRTWRVTDLLEQKRHPYKDMRGLYKAGTAYRSVPWAPLHWSCATLTIRDHLRKSAVRYSPCPGYSRSTIGVDGY